ncbi:unnamed protein product [Gongylonema pulchrum]|uniref:Uncharacterized protein n=1 Tax=Gongylonema pulchrum TaxID=637853 RepID=A0A183DWR3_9BILA|nr:unnamed protein product [Gongylonema pulchrum]
MEHTEFHLQTDISRIVAQPFADAFQHRRVRHHSSHLEVDDSTGSGHLSAIATTFQPFQSAAGALRIAASVPHRFRMNCAKRQ